MSNVARYWLLPGGDPRVVSSQELRRAGISRLRCVPLGKCSREEATARARERAVADPAQTIAHNIRVCMDAMALPRWGVTRGQAEALLAIGRLEITDALGTFGVGYARTDDLLTPEQAGPKLGIEADSVRALCRRGKIPGAFQLSGRWVIPASALRLQVVRVRKRGRRWA